MTLPWKGRCAVYQLTPEVATQMSHKLVYGADELHFLKALALVGMFFQPKAGLRVLTLLRKEKVAPEATDTVVLERSEVVLFFCHPIFQAVKVFPSILFSQMSCPPL